MKVQAIRALKATYPLPLLLAIAGLPRSTFYYHQARPERPDPHAALDAAIGAAFARARGRYGHRRIHRDLVATGWRVAKKTVLARMRGLGLVCLVRRKKRFGPRTPKGLIAPHLLNRNFTAEAPNQKWVTDITTLTVGTERLYLAPMMDLFDRQIIAYTLGRAQTLPLTEATLTAALATLGPDDRPLVHSDQGVQYQHATWRRLLAEAGATPSMSRKGACLDNAVIESFFGHLKTEQVYPTTFPSIEALEEAIHAYIHWYNHERTSATLQGLSPVRYRAQHTPISST